MSETYRQLQSTLPARQAATGGAFASDPRALRSWIDALPMANFSASAKRLLDALQALNQQRVDGTHRLEALEILRGPVMQLALSTERQIIGASFPLPAQKAELGELALQFQYQLASGYRIALAELCGPKGSLPFMRGKQVTLAAVRALQHAAEHLAKAYLLYRTPPAGAWQALHAGYRFVASLRLDEREVDDPLQPGATNARATYLHALLLAIVNPYRYTQREQAEIGALTRTLTAHAHLRDRNGSEQDVSIDTDGDSGPGYLPEERVSGARGMLSVHLDPLLAFIESQLAMAPMGAASALFRVRGGTTLHIDIDLARRLLAGWGARAERGHVRLGGGYVLDTVLGLHDLHFMLAGSENFESFMQRVRGQAISLSEADHGASWRIGASDPGRATRLAARVLDQGLGGYRLLWDRDAGDGTVRARVAELVGLALPAPDMDNKPEWMVGVIRWIRIDDQGRVDAGVELLARRALPVGVRALEGGDTRSPVRGILLAPLETGRGAEHDALLVPTEIDRTITAVELTIPADLQGPPMPARTAQVHGLRAIGATGIYQHFALDSDHPQAHVSRRDGRDPQSRYG